MSDGGIYKGPGGQLLHGNGKPVGSPKSSLAASTGSVVVEPLKSVEWQFPLGSGVARLSIVSDEITPADMDALQEMSVLIKRQLERRDRGVISSLPTAQRSDI